MYVIVKLLGLILIVEGIFLIARPGEVMAWGLKLLGHPRFRYFGLINLLLGAALCKTAPDTRHALLIFLFGCGMIVKAGYVFFAPLERISNHWIFKLETGKLRAIGIAVLVLGLVVLGA
ncbi:MAG: hypothetical protein JW844_05425 [Candidatus Omnitrophica bacterium]|nr:hypothetical protein [Candidatus Omnitrophota bacterium]